MALTSSSCCSAAWRHSSSQKVGLHTDTRARLASASRHCSVTRRQVSMSASAAAAGGTASTCAMCGAASPKYSASEARPMGTPLAVRCAARVAGLMDQ
jgi:hypothetical protein